MAAAEDLSWMELALCREVQGEFWFPEKGEPIDEARAVCRRCPVCTTCANYAIKHEVAHGVWGALSVKERQQIWRRGTAA